MTLELPGRHVVVTGGTGALGRAVVEAFVEAGAVCHVPHRGAAPADLAPHERLHLVGGVELADEARVARFYADLPSVWASVQVAGGFAAAPLLATSLADLRAQLDQNLVSAFLCCREAARRMGAAGGGRLVNVASSAAVDIEGGKVAYTIAKAGVIALTRALAAELAPVGVLVNAVVPSTIDTPANRAAMLHADPARWSKPGDIARAIAWLAGPDNRGTTGAIVPV
jgi:NAD(P)-dependent dehydrogenase (short-subunit alcohol dehydrogenase family)